MANIYTDIKMFDAENYFANNPDLAEAGLTVENVGIHYAQYGAAEGRMPNSWFDVAFYREQNADLAELSDGELLFHFAQYGAAEGRNPNPAFGEGQTIAADLYLDYALANQDLLDAFGIAADATRLTDEQQANVANHFFVYGVTEGREGGIANIYLDPAAAAEAAIVDYQSKVAAEAKAKEAQLEAAKEAMESDVVAKVEDAKAEAEEGDDTDTTEEGDDTDTTEEGDFDVGAAKDKIDELVDFAAAEVRGSGENALIPAAVEIDATSVGKVEDILQGKIDLAQTAVDNLDAKHAAVVALQQKMLDASSAAAKANATNKALKGEVAKFKALNDVEVEVGLPLDEAPFHAHLGEDLVVVIHNGKTVVYKGAVAETDGWDDNGVPMDSDGAKLPVATAADKADLEHLDALVAALEASHGNFKLLDQANLAIEKAIVKVLKDAGYKYQDADGKAADWSKATFDDSGDLVGTVLGKDGEVFAFNPGYAPLAQNAGNLSGDYDPIENENVVNGKAVIEAGVFGVDIQAAADATSKAVTQLNEANEALASFKEAVADYEALVEIQADFASKAADVAQATKAVTAAEKAIKDLDYNLVKDAASDGTVYDADDAEQLADLFVYAGEKIDPVNYFDGEDDFYFGKAANGKEFTFKLVGEGQTVQSQADANVFEIFAVQDNEDTVLYIEKAAFAGSAQTELVDNKDLVTIKLAGVNAEDLAFESDFMYFA